MTDIVSCFTMPINGQYKPKKDHPWKQYKVRFDADGKPPKEENTPSNGKPLKDFLFDLVECWDTYTVDSEFKGSVDYRKIAKMSDRSVAVWLSDFIQKHWAKTPYENRILG